MRSFYECRSQKHKKLLDLTVFFALLVPAYVKGARRMLIKLTPCLCHLQSFRRVWKNEHRHPHHAVQSNEINWRETDNVSSLSQTFNKILKVFFLILQPKLIKNAVFYCYRKCQGIRQTNSLFTTFEARSSFWGIWDISGNCLEAYSNPWYCINNTKSTSCR